MSPNITKPNNYFDLSFICFDEMAQSIDLFILL